MNEARARLHKPPLTIHGCAFAQSPYGDDAANPAGLSGLVEMIREAKTLGFDEMIVDCNFWSEIASPAAWAALPKRLQPVLDAARGAR